MGGQSVDLGDHASARLQVWRRSAPAQLSVGPPKPTSSPHLEPRSRNDTCDRHHACQAGRLVKRRVCQAQARATSTCSRPSARSLALASAVLESQGHPMRLVFLSDVLGTASSTPRSGALASAARAILPIGLRWLSRRSRFRGCGPTIRICLKRERRLPRLCGHRAE